MASSSTALDILNFTAQYSIYTFYIRFICGIIGNILNILVFTHLTLFRDNRSAFLLIVESIIDTIYLISYLPIIVLQQIYVDDIGASSLFWCRLRLILIQTSTVMSFSTICLAAFDQFCSTSPLVFLRQLCTLKLVRKLTTVAFCIWFLHSIVFSLFLDNKTSFGCIISNPTLVVYASVFFYPILFGLLPIVVSLSFSCLAFRNVRRIVRLQLPIIRRRLDRQMTAMVLLRVVCFVIVTFPTVVYRIYSINTRVTKADLLKYAINQLIAYITSSLFGLNFVGNFYIFMLSSSRYRHQVKYFLVKRCWQRWKRWRCVRQNQVGFTVETPPVSNLEVR